MIIATNNKMVSEFPPEAIVHSSKCSKWIIAPSKINGFWKFGYFHNDAKCNCKKQGIEK